MASFSFLVVVSALLLLPVVLSVMISAVAKRDVPRIGVSERKDRAYCRCILVERTTWSLMAAATALAAPFQRSLSAPPQPQHGADRS